MRKWLNIDLSFSKREFNGILILIFIIGIITAVPSVYAYLVPDRDDLPAERAALKKLVLIEARLKKTNLSKWGKVKPKEIKLFNFDPNRNSRAQWESLGLSPKQAQVLINYVSKGGKFRKKEDLQKMFVISAERYKALLPYIYITDHGKQDTAYQSRYPVKAAPVMVDLNTADTTELDKIRGIGPAFARRIFKYRERVGGFYKKEQLLEVYGVDTVKYKEISGQIKLSNQPLTRIFINTIDFEKLSRNPYLKFKEVNAIIQFRKQHGNYANIADLKKVVILSAETVEKLMPYISFEQ